MVKVWYDSGYRRGLTIEAHGHATGSPEHCAMISALLGAWSTVCDENSGEILEGDGEYRGHCRDGVERYAAFRCILNGLRRVQETGPEYISIEAHRFDNANKCAIMDAGHPGETGDNRHPGETGGGNACYRS